MGNKVQFWGRRKGRSLSNSRKKVLLNVLSKYAINLDSFDYSIFNSKNINNIHLEIGSGNGESIVNLAIKFPNDLFLASEPFINGVANLAFLINRFKIDNIYIFPDDARNLIKILPDNMLKNVYLLFPDPWPKFRHRNRRFINDGNLDEISRLLSSGGKLWIASDHLEYCRWMLFRVRNHNSFKWQARIPEDWKVRPDPWIASKYELKASLLGMNPIFLEFKKC